MKSIRKILKIFLWIIFRFFFPDKLCYKSRKFKYLKINLQKKTIILICFQSVYVNIDFDKNYYMLTLKLNFFQLASMNLLKNSALFLEKFISWLNINLNKHKHKPLRFKGFMLQLEVSLLNWAFSSVFMPHLGIGFQAEAYNSSCYLKNMCKP